VGNSPRAGYRTTPFTAKARDAQLRRAAWLFRFWIFHFGFWIENIAYLIQNLKS
jgi:hypothetical protein